MSAGRSESFKSWLPQPIKWAKQTHPSTPTQWIQVDTNEGKIGQFKSLKGQQDHLAGLEGFGMDKNPSQ